MNNFKNKIWYRIIKMVYIILFIFTLLFTIKLIYDKNPVIYINKILCTDGSTLIRKTNDSSQTSFLKEKECLGIKEFNKYGYLLPVERVEGSNKIDIPLFVKTISYLLLDIFSVVIIFWLLKRIFFYIITGKKILE